MAQGRTAATSGRRRNRQKSRSPAAPPPPPPPLVLTERLQPMLRPRLATFPMMVAVGAAILVLEARALAFVSRPNEFELELRRRAYGDVKNHGQFVAEVAQEELGAMGVSERALAVVYGTGAAAGEPPLNVVQSIDPATGAAVQRIMSVAEFLPLFQAKLREAPCRAGPATGGVWRGLQTACMATNPRLRYSCGVLE